MQHNIDKCMLVHYLEIEILLLIYYLSDELGHLVNLGHGKQIEDFFGEK